MQLSSRQRGFSLTEMAVVFAIVALLIGGATITLQAQIDARNIEETQRRLNAVVDATIAFAIVNRRLPCPARYTSSASNSGGVESFCVASTGTCSGTETTTVQTHGNCSNFYDGYVPATTLGIAPIDSQGFAVDVWGNRIRYAIARDFLGGSCTTTPPANTRIWSSQSNLKTYGVSCKPNDIDVCATSTGTTTTCNTATRVVSANTAVLVVFSTGRNGATSSTYWGDDEKENTDGVDAVFVSRIPTYDGATAGLYDDQLVILPVGVLYNKLISAGALP